MRGRTRFYRGVMYLVQGAYLRHINCAHFLHLLAADRICFSNPRLLWWVYPVSLVIASGFSTGRPCHACKWWLPLVFLLLCAICQAGIFRRSGQSELRLCIIGFSVALTLLWGSRSRRQTHSGPLNLFCVGLFSPPTQTQNVSPVAPALNIPFMSGCALKKKKKKKQKTTRWVSMATCTAWSVWRVRERVRRINCSLLMQTASSLRGHSESFAVFTVTNAEKCFTHFVSGRFRTRFDCPFEDGESWSYNKAYNQRAHLVRLAPAFIGCFNGPSGGDNSPHTHKDRPRFGSVVSVAVDLAQKIFSANVAIAVCFYLAPAKRRSHGARL